MSDRLILQPTSIAQWHALVSEAEVQVQTPLTEEVESYLVFLLMRFANRPEMSNSVLAKEFLHGLHQVGEIRHDILRDLGDKCLLFSGFFPEQAKAKHVSDSYFMDLGQSAYAILADAFNITAALYEALARAFAKLIAILKAMRQLTAPGVIDFSKFNWEDLERIKLH